MNRSLLVVCAGLFVVAPVNNVRPALDYLPSIPKGDIAIQLMPIATGMAAPDYGISPPGDISRLFVVEQNGLCESFRTAACCRDLRSIFEISCPMHPWHRPAQPGQCQRRARLSGPGVSSGLQQPSQPRLSHALHLHQRSHSAPADLPGPERRHAELQESDHRVEDVGGRSECGRSDVAPRDHLVRQERRQSQRRHRSPSARTATCTWHWATAATPTTSAPATSSRAATRRT